MKILLPLILFCTVILGGYSAVFQMRPKNYQKQRSCFEEEAKFYKWKEQTNHSGETCLRLVCEVIHGKVSLEVQGCGRAGPAPVGCYKTANLSLPYPHCCERYVCPNERETMNPTSQNSLKKISHRLKK